MSRPFVLALLAAVLTSATFVSMRPAGERAQADASTPAPTVQSTASKPTKAPSKAAVARAQAATKEKAAAAQKAAANAGVPPKVRRALAAKRTVVLFFRQPGGDDIATASAVATLRGTKGVSVFSASISKLARFRRVVGSLGVTQAPAVVIVDKDRKATVVEGFVDSGSLKQQVKDVR